MIHASKIGRFVPILPFLLFLACNEPIPGTGHGSLVESGELYQREATENSPGYLPFETGDRIAALESGGMYPCTDCHDGIDLEPNPEERILVEEHDTIELEHGNGRFWCDACHHLQERDQLTNIKGETLGFNQSHTLCGQCHFQQLRDFQGGAHGKRLFNWSGPRTIAQCTECHNPHQPQIKKREPKPPPAPRRGLSGARIDHGQGVQSREGSAEAASQTQGRENGDDE